MGTVVRGTVLALAALLTGCSGDRRFVDLWATRAQQGQWLLDRGRFGEAAGRYADPLSKGVALYRADSLDAALEWFAHVPGAEGFFNSGNAYARLGRYEEAVEAFDQALALRPAWTEARENRDLVAGLIPPEPDAGEQSPGDPTLRPDSVQFDERGKQGKSGAVDQLLSQEQQAETWMRGIRSSPADFLRLKFAQQAAEGGR